LARLQSAQRVGLLVNPFCAKNSCSPTVKGKAAWQSTQESVSSVYSLSSATGASSTTSSSTFCFLSETSSAEASLSDLFFLTVAGILKIKLRSGHDLCQSRWIFWGHTAVDERSKVGGFLGGTDGGGERGFVNKQPQTTGGVRQHILPARLLVSVGLVVGCRVQIGREAALVSWVLSLLFKGRCSHAPIQEFL